MGLSVDTSQLIAQFTTDASQSEWSDVENALLEAFPGKSMDEIHAAATAYLSSNPDATFDELLTGLQSLFSVTLSTEMAAQIRSEWDEFNEASDLNPSELLAVLDDYGADSVDTGTQAYLLYLVQYIQKIIEEVTSDTASSSQKADRVGYESAKEQYEKQVAEALESRKASSIFGKIMSWVGAAAAVIGAIVATVAAVAVSVGTAGAGAVPAVVAINLAWAGAVIAMGLAVSAIVGAATDGEYSIAGLVAKGMEACGVDEETAGYIGMGVEIGLAVLGALCSLGAGIASAAGSGAKTATDVTTQTTKVVTKAATKAAEEAAKKLADIQKFAKVMSVLGALSQVGTGLASGAQAGVDLWAGLNEAALTEAQALLDQLVAILKATQKTNEQGLEIIFGSIRDVVVETTQEYTSILNNAARMDMA